MATVFYCRRNARERARPCEVRAVDEPPTRWPTTSWMGGTDGEICRTATSDIRHRYRVDDTATKGIDAPSVRGPIGRRRVADDDVGFRRARSLGSGTTGTTAA